MSASRRLGGEVGGVPRTRPTKKSKRPLHEKKKNRARRKSETAEHLARAKYRVSSWIPVGRAAWNPKFFGRFFRDLARDADARGVPPRRRARGRRAGKSSGVASGSRIAGRLVAKLACRDARPASPRTVQRFVRRGDSEKLTFAGKSQKRVSYVARISRVRAGAGEARARPGRGREGRAPAKYITGKSSCVLQLCDPR